MHLSEYLYKRITARRFIHSFKMYTQTFVVVLISCAFAGKYYLYIKKWSNSEKGAQWTPDPFCPYPSYEVTRYPYYGDCSLYWECYAGNHYLYNCPDGLWWHQAISECDYPGDFCGASTLTGKTMSWWYQFWLCLSRWYRINWYSYDQRHSRSFVSSSRGRSHLLSLSWRLYEVLGVFRRG